MLESVAPSLGKKCPLQGREWAVMSNPSVLVRVPATVGNFGGATDRSALALDAPLNVKVTPRFDGQVGIRYFGDHGERVPRDRSNLVVRAMEAALGGRGLEFTGADFEIYSSVPVAVGLGSSTAAVLAGLLAADQLFRLGFDEKTLFGLATSFEYRQDNLRAAWFGGLVTCTDEESASAYQHTPVPDDFSFCVVVPEAILAAGPQGAPPSARAKRAGNSSHQNRASSLLNYFTHPGGGFVADSDEPFPPTCEKNTPGLGEALRVRVPGTLSVFVCGSGPAIGILAQENADEAVAAVRRCFSQQGVGSSAASFRPTNSGARDWNAVLPDITLPALGGRGVQLPKPSINPV
jgi:homoserine kinase